MKVVVCEMCGARGLVKRGGLYVCAGCGTRYEAKEARGLLIDVPDGNTEGDNQEECQAAEKVEPQVESSEIEEDGEDAKPLAAIWAKARAESSEAVDGEEVESPANTEVEPHDETPTIAGAGGEERDAIIPISRNEEPEAWQQPSGKPLHVYIRWRKDGGHDVIVAEIHDTETNLDSCYIKRYELPLGSDRRSFSRTIADEIEGAIGRPVKWRMVEDLDNADQRRPRTSSKTTVVVIMLVALLAYTFAGNASKSCSKSCSNQEVTTGVDYSSLVSGALTSKTTGMEMRIKGDKLCVGPDTYTIIDYDETEGKLTLSEGKSPQGALKDSVAYVNSKNDIFFQGHHFT